MAGAGRPRDARDDARGRVTRLAQGMRRVDMTYGANGTRSKSGERKMVRGRGDDETGEAGEG